MSIEIVQYRTMMQMTESVRAEVCKMGHSDRGKYHLRAVAAGSGAYKLRSCIVLFYNGIPVGWNALYYDSFCSPTFNDTHCSIFVLDEYRRRGFGGMLMKDGFRRWKQRFNPIVHAAQQEYWYKLQNKS